MKKAAVRVAERVCPKLLHLFRQRLYAGELPCGYRGAPPTLFVMKDRNAGLFSLFFQALGALDFCRSNGHDLVLDFCGGPYAAAPGQNWWKSYFTFSEFAFSKEKPARVREIADLREQHLFAEYGKNIPAAVARELLCAIGLGPVAAISEKVSAAAAPFEGKRVVGVHYRGTDKANESLRVPYQYVSGVLSRNHDAHFFVATDEAAFLEYLSRCYPGRVLNYDAVRSATAAPVHLDAEPADRYRLGEEALIDCLLLSRCDVLLRTDSNLSAACSFFNPRLKVVNLTDQYTASLR